MPVQSIPISKGMVKAADDIEYTETLPVNMVAVPTKLVEGNGYMRSFPGLTQYKEVTGTSRGVQFNVARNSVFRVIGNDVYENGEYYAPLGLSINLDTRVKMAHSHESQAVAANGTMKLFKYDGTTATLAAWSASSGNAVIPVGRVNDITRNKGRYIWSQEGSQLFGVTDLEDETHPDRFRPFITAESQPDGIVGVGAWREFVIAFGSATIEYFELTGTSDGSQPIYIANPSMMINKGIAGTFAKCQFMETYAILTGPSNGQPGVYMLSTGATQKISPPNVDRIIEKYSAEELEAAILESFRFRGHEFLILHLPGETLCFDGSVMQQNGLQWTLLQTGLNPAPHRGIDYCFDGERVTVADKTGSRWGVVDNTASAQYGESQEHILYTPMLPADNSFLFDLRLEASTGRTGLIESILVSCTQDGLTYGPEFTAGYDKPLDYNRRVIRSRLGRVRRNIGFKIRCISSGPVTLSNLTVRSEQ